MGRERRGAWGMMLAVSALSLAGAAPAAASRAGCFKTAPSGAKKANRYSESGQGIVLRAHGLYYGCSFRRGKSHLLPGQDGGGEILRDSIQVARRHAAYGIVFQGSNGPVTGLYSVRLWSGTAWVASTDPEWENIVHWGENVTLDDLVLRPNGSIAWQGSWPVYDPEGDQSYRVVMGFDHGTSGKPKFEPYDDDRGRTEEGRIRRTSLDISHTGRNWRISWVRSARGAPIFAPIH
jgi:hypothetical protein